MSKIFLDTSAWNSLLKGNEEVKEKLFSLAVGAKVDVQVSWDVLDELVNEVAYDSKRFAEYAEYMDRVCNKNVLLPYNHCMAIEFFFGRQGENEYNFYIQKGINGVADAMARLTPEDVSEAERDVKQRKEKFNFHWAEGLKNLSIDLKANFDAEARKAWVQSTDFFHDNVIDLLKKHLKNGIEKISEERTPTGYAYCAYLEAAKGLSVASIDSKQVSPNRPKRIAYDQQIYASAAGARCNSFVTSDQGQFDIANWIKKKAPSAVKPEKYDEFIKSFV